MASNAPYTITDDDATDHVFDPVGIEGGVASYANFAESMGSGRETVRFSHKDGKTVEEHSIVLRMPYVVETTIEGVTRRVVENFGSAQVKFLIPPTWTEDQRQDLRSVAAGLLAATPIVKMVERGEFVW